MKWGIGGKKDCIFLVVGLNENYDDDACDQIVTKKVLNIGKQQ